MKLKLVERSVRKKKTERDYNGSLNPRNFKN